MKVRVHYLGAFAEAAHAKEAVCELTASSLDSLVDHLIERNGAKFRALMIDPATGVIRGGTVFLVNGHRIDLKYPLLDNDEIVLLSPLAGG